MANETTLPRPVVKTWRTKLADSDILASFLASPATIIAGILTLIFLLVALLAPWISPFNPFDPAQVFLIDARDPPIWMADSDKRFLLGTDDQGRDMLSALFYGIRISLLVGGLGVLLSAVIGVTLGLIAGYAGGRTDAIIMRIADIQLTFPAILIALLVDGIVHAVLKNTNREASAFGVMVLSIGLSFWVQYARTVRGSTLVEKNKDYVQAARLIGLRPIAILWRHVLPNVMGPVLVIATINLALAVITEATLSFLGVGLPPTQPSLGTLIRIGNTYLFSGEWWIVAFPGIVLAALVIAVNMLGDWLRDALNPRLR